MHWLRNVFGKVRESRSGIYDLNLRVNSPTNARHSEEANSQRLFGYSLLGLINSKFVDGPQSEEDAADEGEEEDSMASRNNRAKGLANNQKAWCWRDNCEGDGHFDIHQHLV